jgi:hypothetical protein
LRYPRAKTRNMGNKSSQRYEKTAYGMGKTFANCISEKWIISKIYITP